MPKRQQQQNLSLYYPIPERLYTRLYAMHTFSNPIQQDNNNDKSKTLPIATDREDRPIILAHLVARSFVHSKKDKP